MSGEPVWVLRQALLLKHAESLGHLGGAEGRRDFSALEKALFGPRNPRGYSGEPNNTQNSAP